MPYQFTTNSVASGTIRKGRFAKVSGTNTVAECSAATDVPCGVTTLSSRRWDDETNVALVTEPVPFQQPDEVFLYVDDVTGITAGSKISPGATGGAVIYANLATNVPAAEALETPSANGVFMRVRLLSKTAPGA